jgi:hypothetical protein
VEYMLLVCGEPIEAEPDPSVIAESIAWMEEMNERGVRKFGSRLAPASSATTLRGKAGKVLVSDGPFAETKEQIVGALIRITGDWDLAEDCAQEALARALERWPADGLPRTPGAWLTTTARNHALNRLRRVAIETDRVRRLGAMASREDGGRDDVDGFPDERLSLIFTCCHPTLSLEGQVALTLRTLTRSAPIRSPGRCWSASRRWRSAWSGPNGRSARRGFPSGCRRRSSWSSARRR